MLDTIFHKYLRLPYRLHVHVDRRVKKARATVLFLHGMGNSATAWDAVVAKLPDDIRVISVDLLGFGASPSPRWLKYNTEIQAKSVMRTLMRLKMRRKMIIVGHSMGSLVAVEMAKRYPVLVKSLILCSPPFYTASQRKRVLPTQMSLLERFYALIQKYPKNVARLVPVATKLKIVGKAFNVTKDNVDIYMAALESSILDQTGYIDILTMKKPTTLIYGALDPIIIKKNLETIAKTNAHVSLKSVVAGHELLGAYVPAVVKAVDTFTHKPISIRKSQ